MPCPAMQCHAMPRNAMQSKQIGVAFSGLVAAVKNESLSFFLRLRHLCQTLLTLASASTKWCPRAKALLVSILLSQMDNVCSWIPKCTGTQNTMHWSIHHRIAEVSTPKDSHSSAWCTRGLALESLFSTRHFALKCQIKCQCRNTYMYVYIYIYMYTCMYIYIHIYIYIDTSSTAQGIGKNFNDNALYERWIELSFYLFICFPLLPSSLSIGLSLYL